MNGSFVVLMFPSHGMDIKKSQAVAVTQPAIVINMRTIVTIKAYDHFRHEYIRRLSTLSNRIVANITGSTPFKVPFMVK